MNRDDVTLPVDSLSGTASPLAVVGIACLFPKADGLGAYWANIKNRVDAITAVPPTHWHPEDYHDSDPKSPDRVYTTRGGFLEPFNFSPGSFGIAPNDLEAIDTAQLLGLAVARQALLDAGYDIDRGLPDRNRVGVILGVTGTLELVIPLGARLGHPRWRRALKEAGVEDAVADDVVRRIGESYVGWQENSFPGLLGNVVAGRIANRLDLGGTNCVVDAACASSLSALHLASLELQTGRADVVVTGGVDTFNDIFMYMCFSKTPALSPTGDARPFDAAGDGTILGEGLGMVVLKRLADAERDGDRVYAVIRGVGSSSDGKGDAVYAPKAAGQVTALKSAYANAGVNPATIELVEAHGTGTRVGDATEVTALTEVYSASGRTRTWCALGSVKSQIGHTKAAAGAAGLIKAIAALYHKVLPPTIKVQEPLTALRGGASPFYINTEKRPWLPSNNHARRAAVSAFGFGGSNFHCVLEEAQPVKTAIDWDSDVQILAFAADSPAAIEQQLAEWPADLTWNALRTRAAQTRREWRPDAPCRLLLVLQRDRTDWSRLLTSVRSALKQDRATWRTPDGAFYGTGPTTGKLAVLFSGQGAQYPGMLRDLVCQFPSAFDVLVEADRAFTADRSATSTRLSDYLYPLSAFTANERADNEAALRATDIAQPALGAVSLGAWRVLEHFGVHADAMAGHSYGELTALCAAGRLAEKDFHTLSNLRGRLMAAANPGGMLAVQAEPDVIATVMREEHLDLTQANKNAPTQTVLSGRSEEIERAAVAFATRKIQARQLAVGGAFHSPLVADARQPLRVALKEIPLSPGQLPVYANTIAAAYPDEPNEARDLLAGQLGRPVEFVAEIEAIYQSGVRTFIEVGPGARLTGLVDAILRGREVDTIAIDATAGQRSGTYDLACVLALLAARGHAVDLSAWDANFVPVETTATDSKRPALTIPLCGANYVKPRPTNSPASRRAADTLKSATNGTIRSNINPPLNNYQSHAADAPPVPAAAPENRTVSNRSTAAPVDGTALAQALEITRESLAALQKMQEQTANLHRQFLEGQENAQRSLQALIEQQQRLLQSTFGLASFTPAVSPAPVSFSPPPSVVVAPPAPVPSTSSKVLSPVTSTTPESSTRNEKEQTKPAPTKTSLVETEHPHIDQTKPADTSAIAVTPSTRIEQVLMEVVAEKTGYPVEMLDPDMALDSDLGIDSIKRVEILSALQERLPEAPTVGPEHLGTLLNLRQIAEFLAQSTPVAIPTPEPLVSPTVHEPATAPSLEHVSKVLLEVVAEKTGYPVEMLDPDMALDADLGIDSIKRVEILSALQERLPDAPTVGPEHLGTLHNLRQIAEFLAGSSAQVAETAHVVENVQVVDTERTKTSDEPSATVRDFTAPGYPAADTFSLPANMSVDVGSSGLGTPFTPIEIRTESPHPLSITDESVGVGSSSPLSAGMQKSHVKSEASQLGIERSVLQLEPLTAPGSRQVVQTPAGTEVWIAPDDDELAGCLEQQLRRLGYETRLLSPVALRDEDPPPALGGLVLVAPTDPPGDALLKDALRGLQRVAKSLRAAGRDGGAVLATVSRLDGAFGLRAIDAAREPVDGGLAGFAKTAEHEWSEVHCKALDVSPDMDPHAAAVAVASELFLAGPSEVGIGPKGRFTLRRVPEPLSADIGPGPFAPDDVIIVSGGARGVTAEAAVAMARHFRSLMVLLGRNPAPKPEPEWLARLTDEVEIKRELAGRVSGGASLKQVGEQYAKIVAAREIQQTLDRIEATGAKAVYLTVDVREPKVVADLLGVVRKELGPIRGIFHGAGVLADGLIEDKTDAQFERVYSTKVDGLRSLLGAVDPEELRALVIFSSTTGRFGRAGQSDYAAANETLNKIARQQAAKLPNCRVLAVNWGPWDGGMVTPSLKQLFAREGIPLIAPADGAEYLIRELCSPAPSPVEVVVLGGPLPEMTTSVPAVVEPAAAAPALPVAFERVLEIADYPVLESHVLDGRPVVPVALMFEWLAHAALHQNPGLAFYGINDLRVLHGIISSPESPLSLRVAAGKATRRDGAFVTLAEMRSTRPDGREVLHVRAEVVLAADPPTAPPPAEEPATNDYPRGAEEIYRSLLFHGPELHGIEQVEGCSKEGIVARSRNASPPLTWLRQPLRQKWLTDPLVLDSSFQMMILWSLECHAAGSLPCHVQRYRQFRRSFPAGGARIVARVTHSTSLHALADIDFLDTDGRVIARLEGYECVLDPGLQRAFRHNRLAPAGVT